jgi:hypothetical protein
VTGRVTAGSQGWASPQSKIDRETNEKIRAQIEYWYASLSSCSFRPEIPTQWVMKTLPWKAGKWLTASIFVGLSQYSFQPLSSGIDRMINGLSSVAVAIGKRVQVRRSWSEWTLRCS